MDNTWVKLYRKAIDHPVFRDEAAWRVWTWILMSVDYETGEMTSGRFRGAEILGVSSSKFRHIIDRLRDKYDLIETTNKHSHTSIKVKNWHKYQVQSSSIAENSKIGPAVGPQTRPQADYETRPQADDVITYDESQNQDVEGILRPQKRSQEHEELGPQVTATKKATNQEVKNTKEIKKESNVPASEISQIADSPPDGKKKQVKPRITYEEYLSNIPAEDVKKFTEEYNINEEQLIKKCESLYRWWCSLSEKKKRERSNPVAFLHRILLDDFGKRVVVKRVESALDRQSREIAERFMARRPQL